VEDSAKTEAQPTENATKTPSTEPVKPTQPRNDDRITRLERLVTTSLLAQEKRDLPEGFNHAVLDGMDPVDQIEFLTRFKAAMPKIEQKQTDNRKVGATVPAKPAKATEDSEPGSMAERSRIAREKLAEHRKAGGPGIIAGGFYK